MPASRHARELRERVMQRGRPDLAALEDDRRRSRARARPRSMASSQTRAKASRSAARTRARTPASRLAQGASRWQSAVWTIRSMGVAA